MGVPMNSLAWAAIALQTHPATVQLMHELYIKAGVDIITTNTYAAARHNLEPIGLGDLTGELNRRAVMLAREARDKASGGRPVLIAGSISNYGMTTGGEDYLRWRPRTRLTEEQLRNNLSEQSELLREAGADFLLAESTGSNTHRKWVSDACKASGMPFWVGFKCRREPNETDVRMGRFGCLSKSHMTGGRRSAYLRSAFVVASIRVHLSTSSCQVFLYIASIGVASL
jgi:S-methylmethionine-dependent homocysteine/selenocysteine methylase